EEHHVRTRASELRDRRQKCTAADRMAEHEHRVGLDVDRLDAKTFDEHVAHFAAVRVFERRRLAVANAEDFTLDRMRHWCLPFAARSQDSRGKSSRFITKVK